MATTTTCRAKDPSSCWMHGNPNTKSVRSLFDPYMARTAIRTTKRAAEVAYVERDADAFLEAKGEEDLAKLNYDASIYGLSDISKVLDPINRGDLRKINYAERVDLELRRDKAIAHREDLLNREANAKESKKNVAKIKAEYGVQNFESTDSIYAAKDELNRLPYGTPVLIETGNGYFVERTGGGDKPGEKRTRLDKAFNGTRKFIQEGFKEDENNFGIVFASSGGVSWSNNVKSLTVLSPNFKASDDLLPRYAKKLEGLLPPAENGRYAVTGDGFYYEFEGMAEKDGYGNFTLRHPRNDVNYNNDVDTNTVTGWYEIPTIPILLKK
jgi:hypothetical protein